jgi:hypothetical protein
MGIDALTCGERVPSVRTIRRRMGKPGPQTTNVTDFARAVPTFKAPGRKPLDYRIVRTIAEVRQAVESGHYVHLCVDYGAFNRETAKSGDPNFTGGHSLGVKGQEVRDGATWWRLYDPLDDARRQGIPQGPRWVKREALVKAMEAFAGAQHRAWAGVFTGGSKT